MSLAYLTACYILGRDYHSGQWSRGYLLLCHAAQYARREYLINLGQVCESLDRAKWEQNQAFRNELAFWLKGMRKHRNVL